MIEITVWLLIAVGGFSNNQATNMATFKTLKDCQEVQQYLPSMRISSRCIPAKIMVAK